MFYIPRLSRLPAALNAGHECGAIHECVCRLLMQDTRVGLETSTEDIDTPLSTTLHSPLCIALNQTLTGAFHALAHFVLLLVAHLSSLALERTDQSTA